MIENPPQGQGLAALSTTAEADLPEMAMRILHAAMTLFARKGYAATSVREIVQEANVTNPMLYYYFGNKQGVFEQLIDLLFGEMDARISQIFESDDRPLRQQIRAMVDVHLDAVEQAPQALQFVYSVLFGPRDARPPVDLFERRQQTILLIVAAFDRAIARGELAPHPGFDSLFLATQVLGNINQHLMLSLKFFEDDEKLPQARAMFEAMMSDMARARLVHFVLAGAGAVEHEDER